jgi:hypothetical protein
VRRAAIVVDLTARACPCLVVGTHMSHLQYGSHRHYGALNRLLRTEARPDAVLLGDMNLWGPPVRAFLPGWHRAVKGRTWPAWNPHSQIDHILVRGDVRDRLGRGAPRRRLRPSPGARRADPAIIASCSTPTSTSSPGSRSPAVAFAFGFERQLRGSPAGNRTFVLIGGTAAAITAVAGTTSPQAMAGILTGIGFIGAGLVFVHGATVRGLTSAATVFAVAGIGIVFGYGHLYLGLFVGMSTYPYADRFEIHRVLPEVGLSREEVLPSCAPWPPRRTRSGRPASARAPCTAATTTTTTS